MKDTVTRYLAGVASGSDKESLRAILNPIADRLSSQTLTSAGLRIKGGSASVTVQAHTLIHAIAQGVPITKAVDTDMAVLSGSVTNAKFNVYCFYVDSGGTLTSAMGTEGAAFANVVFPVTPVGKALIGYVLVNPTGTGPFVGGTTQLDDGTVVPNAVFVNTIGAVDPSILL